MDTHAKMTHHYLQYIAQSEAGQSHLQHTENNLSCFEHFLPYTAKLRLHCKNIS